MLRVQQHSFISIANVKFTAGHPFVSQNPHELLRSCPGEPVEGDREGKEEGNKSLDRIHPEHIRFFGVFLLFFYILLAC